MNKPKGWFAGTLVDDGKLIQPQGDKKPFIGLTIEGDKGPNQKFANRVKAVVYSTYPNPIESEVALFRKGVRIEIDGEIDAEAYISTKTQKPVGITKVFVRSYSFASQAAPVAPAASQQPELPSTQAKDDVPF